ncbi:ParB/RepB/Spo0J family partition protein [Hathewaya limosa]|uniref:ParB family chromosome partitioning protein n=1 Tax=Hathewaya limosa TaxID=1536 RepID=A0ABU0JR61_HATLI|nr:ParB/RepB/Spo0J family partition protein [Hathewaya limosa]MDQ0478736.1 ParB family chromosome partitioning protein [Hathewaya limosa]
MSKKYGLGKGLGALIPQTPNNTQEKERQTSSVNKVWINLIKPNPEQPRKSFDDEKISELSKSIKENGIIQPLILKRLENKTYIIIAGERRWRAARLANLKEVPAVILEDIGNDEVLKLSLIENIQREDLNPIEEALAYDKLIQDLKITQQQLSEKMGKSRTAIANSLRLLNLDKTVKEYLVDGVISEGHGRALLGLNDANLQNEIAKKIIDENLSVRQVELLVKHINENRDNKGKTLPKVSPFIKDIQNRLQDYFGTKVEVNTKGKEKGKIQIEYYSQEELQRILDMLNI